MSSRSTLHYVTLRYVTLHYVTLHYITLHYSTLWSVSEIAHPFQDFIILTLPLRPLGIKVTNCARAEQILLNRLAKNITNCVVTIYITLHYITLRYITLRYVTLRYITLHYATLHYITLHYITLHYITLHFGAFLRLPILYRIS